MKWGAVILGAGQGKRLRSHTAKVLHEAHGRPLLQWVLEAVAPLAPAKVVVVVGHRREPVQQYLEGKGVIVVVQDPPAGTGDAVRVALGAVEECEAVMVIPGDAPLLRAASLQGLLTVYGKERPACALLSAVLPDGGSYGRIIREEGRVVGIVEAGDATPEQAAIREVNAGVYVFDVPKIRSVLPDLAPTNTQGEYYLTDVIAGLVKRGEKVLALPLGDPTEMLGVNTRKELAQASRELNRRVVGFWQEQGVTVVDPETTWVEAGCELGQDTVLEPGVHIRGGCRLGPGCRIGAYSVLDGVVLEAGTYVPPLSYVKGD